MNYFSTYADHMWRFYARHMDADITTMTDSSRANWIACDAVYKRLNEETRNYIRIYYATPWFNSNTAVQNWCAEHGTSQTDVWRVIRAVQAMAAEERGIIDQYDVRKTSRHSSQPVRYEGNITEDIRRLGKTSRIQTDAIQTAKEGDSVDQQ